MYEKLAEIVDEDLVISFIKKTEKYKYHSSLLKVPNFIKDKNFPETLSPVEKEFFRAYLIIKTCNISFSSAIEIIKEAILSNDSELVEDIILTCGDRIPKISQRNNGPFYKEELEKFCDKMLELAKEHTGIRIINGLRAFLRGYAERCHELMEQPETTFRYALTSSHPEKKYVLVKFVEKLQISLQVQKNHLV